MELKPGYKQTEAGVIPNEWKVYTIGQTLRLINGCAFNPRDWREKGVPIIRIQNLNDSTASFNYSEAIVDEKYHVVAGDVLFAWSGTKGTSFGARVWDGPNGYLNQHIFKVIANEELLSPYYSFLTLRKVQEDIEKKAHGFKSSFVHVKKSDIVSVYLSIPSLAEQRAIAKALSDIDALLSSLDQLLAKKRDIKQAVMQQLLTGKQRLPGFSGEWKVKTVIDLVQIPVTDGPHTTPRFQDTGVPFLSVNNLIDNRINLEDLRYISSRDHEMFSRKCRPVKNDILLGKAASVGKVAMVELDIEFNIWSPIALLRFSENDYPKFFYYSFQSNAVMKQIALLTNSSSQGNLGMGDIERIKLPVPALTEQIAIADVLSDMDAEINSLQQRRDKTLAFKQGMMQELLTGRTRLV